MIPWAPPFLSPQILAASVIIPFPVSSRFLWILSGASEHDIRDAIAKEWPEADAAPLIVSAVTAFEKAGEFNVGVVAGFCFEAYRELYRKMVEAGDYQGALKAVKLISDLAGR